MGNPPLAASKPANIAPLMEADFSSYDKTPDNQLEINEFSDDAFEKFVWRYIYTDNRAARQVFQHGMTFSLRNKVGDHIQKISEAGVLPEEKQELAKHMLEFEFARNKIVGGGEVYWDIEGTDDHTKEGAQPEYYDWRLKNVLSEYVLFELKPISTANWQLLLSGKAIVSQHFDRMKNGQEGQIKDEDYIYDGVNVKGESAARSLDDRYEISTTWDCYRAHEAPPDTLSSGFNLAYSVSFKNMKLLGRPLSFGADYNWLKEEFSPPIDLSRHLRQGKVSHTLSAEATYRFDKWGVVFDYSFTNADITKQTTESLGVVDHVADALIQFGFGRDKGSNVRLGLGGSSHYEEARSVFEDETTVYDSDNGHLRALMQFNATTNFRLSAEVFVGPEHDEEAFGGWYPVWKLAATGTLDLGKGTIKLDVSYDGRDTELFGDVEADRYQWMHNLLVNASVKHQPRDWLTIELLEQFRFTDITGFKEGENVYGKIQGKVNYNLPMWRWLWLWAYAGVGAYDNTQVLDGEDVYEHGFFYYAGVGIGIEK